MSSGSQAAAASSAPAPVVQGAGLPQEQQPQQLASKQSDWDCLGCRMVGMAFGVGGGGYIMSHLLKQPPPKGGDRLAILVTASTMFAFGMYRALA